MTLVDKNCDSFEWYTPETLLEPIRDLFELMGHGRQIGCDPATHLGNPTEARQYFTKESDGLKHDWNEPIFVNPPYGPLIKPFIKKLYEQVAEGKLAVALLSATRSEQGYWMKHVFSPELDFYIPIRKRVAFINEDGEKMKGNPYASILYVYNCDRPDHVFSSFSKVGHVNRIEPMHEWED